MKESLQNGQSALMKSSDQKQRKIKNNRAELVYLDAITTIGNMVLEARKSKDTEGLRTMSKAITQIAFYVNDLHMERENLYLNL